MKKVFIFFINTLYFTIVIALAFSISTIALTRKINQSKIYTNNLQGAVVKEKVVILTLTRGIVDSVSVKNGQTVKKGDILVKLSNPILENNYQILQQQQNNQSAQTEASIVKINLENLTIKSPVDGVVGELYTSEGSSLSEFTKVMLIYSSSDIRLQADLTTEQYQKIQKLSQVNAYSPRLNQNFTLIPGLLRADEKIPKGIGEKKIGLYFSFKNNEQAAALLNNEDLQITLEENSIANKPVAIFTDFWNGLLAKGN